MEGKKIMGRNSVQGNQQAKNRNIQNDTVTLGVG